ncbi:MAG: DUF5723 family protein [Spirosomataceae bacterium]
MRLRFFSSTSIISSVLAAATALNASAQEYIGQHSSNYAGINRATFNPSSIAGTRYRYHINLISFNATVNNRYFKYFRTDALFHPFKNPYTETDMYGKSKLTGSLTQGEHVNVTAELRTPSGYIGVGKNNWLVVGFQSRMRGFVQGSGVPSALFEIYRDRLDDGLAKASSGNFKDFAFQQHSFFETGLTFAAMPIRLEGLVRLKVGATIKRLSGARNVYLHLKSANYQVRPLNQDEYVLDLSNVSYEYGYTQPVKPFSVGSLFSSDYGSGAAVDLGATVELGRIRAHSQDRANYIVRIGAAITDAGKITYPTTGKQYSGTLNKLSVNQDRIIDLGNNSVKSLETMFGKSDSRDYAYETQLPRTVNIDVDVQPAKSFFVNASWSKPTNSGAIPGYIYQPQLFSLTPRFEGEDVEFTLPVTWLEGNSKPTVGFSVRFGPAYIGFSNFGGLVSRNVQPRGSMAYFGLQLWKLNEKALTKKRKK